MKKQIAVCVLSVHIVLLLLCWGGLSTLGMAAALILPTVAVLCGASYQKGKESARKSKRQTHLESPLPGAFSFRG